MMRTTLFVATVAVAVHLSLVPASAQYDGPNTLIMSPAQAAPPAAGAPIYQPGAMPYGYPVQQVGMISDSGCDSCDSCDGCDGGGCGSCNGKQGGLGGLLSSRNQIFCGYWGSAEYMLMWGKGRHAPPLATTSPAGTPRAQAGVLGYPNTQILFGGDTIGNDEANGLRFSLGGWFDPYQSVGVGVRLTGIDGDNPGFNGNTFSGYPILAVPFFDVVNGQENANLASFPNQLEGSLNVESELDVWAADTYLRAMVLRGCGYRIDVIGGYQYTRIDDGITIHTVATSLPGNVQPVVPGTVFDTWDSFDTRNTFNGGTIGVQTEFYMGRWTLGAMGKVGFGNMHHKVTIQGREIRDVPGGAPFRRNGGLLTQPSNIGTYETDETAFVPEATLSLSYNLNSNLKVTAGYNFIYWTRAVLAGDQIDRNVDPFQILGFPGNEPAFLGFQDTDFWLMGGSLGLEANF